MLEGQELFNALTQEMKENMSLNKARIINIGGRSIKRSTLVINKIAPQFELHIPEVKLMFRVVCQAIEESQTTGEYYKSAMNYINSGMPHAEACNVSAVWIKETMLKCGLVIK